MKRLHREKELNQLQILKKTIEKLKRENASLRKQLARNSLNYENIKDLLEIQNQEQEEAETVDYKKKYSCHICNKGYLRIVILPIGKKLLYFRRCSHHPKCNNRTEKKPYDPKKVKGILETRED